MILDDPRALEAVSREVVAGVLGITLRRFHDLVARGILPAGTGRGVYSLPDMVSAWLAYRSRLSIPATLEGAERAVLRAELARREYLRRTGEAEER